MGQESSGSDLATVVSGTFSGTGQSPSAYFYGDFNFSLWGTFSATVQLERSFDAGSTWLAASEDAIGTAYTAAVSLLATEPEPGVLYRLNCTAFASGPVNYRLSGLTRVYTRITRTLT